MTDSVSICSLCRRERPLSFHHFIPRTCHSNKWFKKRFARQQMQTGIDLYRECHRFIHDQWDEKTLGRELNNEEKLLEQPRLQTFLTWVRKQH